MSRRGAFYALIATGLFGASAPLTKRLLSDVDPWLMAGLLYLGAGTGLLGMLAARRSGGWGAAEVSVSGSGWLFLSGAVFFGGLLAPVFLMTGLSRTEPATASLLLTLECLFTALLAWVFFREGFSGRVLAGAVVVLGGGVFLAWTGAPHLGGFLGPLLIAGACLCWALDNNLTRRIASGDALQISMLKCLAAGVVNTGLAFAVFRRFPPMETWGAACLVGFMGYGVSLFFFVLALRHIGAARAGAYFSTGPFVGAVLSVAMGMERMTGRLLAAGAILSAGVALLLSERREQVR